MLFLPLKLRQHFSSLAQDPKSGYVSPINKCYVFTTGDPCEGRINCQCVFESPLSLFLFLFWYNMKRFGINRERRVDHCLMFDRKTTNTLSPSQRIAMFQTSQPGLSHAAGKESYVEVLTIQNQCCSLGVFSKPINMTTNELMEWQYFLKRRLIEGTLQKRRNAICSEIERTWFLEGSHLEKHRHNLRVTLALQDRGLMMWWLAKGELFEDPFTQHRHNIEKWT